MRNNRPEDTDAVKATAAWLASAEMNHREMSDAGFDLCHAGYAYLEAQLGIETPDTSKLLELAEDMTLSSDTTGSQAITVLANMINSVRYYMENASVDMEHGAGVSAALGDAETFFRDHGFEV